MYVMKKKENEPQKLSKKLPAFKRDLLNQAQELVYDAWEASTLKDGIGLAKQALHISPYCTDAYVMLAESAERMDESVQYYTEGIEVFHKAYGKKFFIENAGPFWGMLETRPYMRALAGLALCLWEMDLRQEAINMHLRMLILNPNDNQGTRYVLINWLIAENMDDMAKDLLSDYPEDSTMMLYSAALLYFKQGKKTKANSFIKKALKANQYVLKCLLLLKKKKSGKKEMIHSYSPGKESEAIVYIEYAGKNWLEIPGALEWLQKSMQESKPPE
jgi:tetratricopeptide (TPR) repeat protein